MIKDHGTWKRYFPPEEDRLPGAPPSTMYAQRESDGLDWYTYVHPRNKFVPGSLKLACLWRDDYQSYQVIVPTYQSEALFPDDRTIYEMIDELEPVQDPIAEYGNKLFDPATGEFTDPPPPVWEASDTEKKILTTLDSIMKRLDKLEKRK
jgi:hypothetical protein